MILDVAHFMSEEKSHWDALETILKRLEADSAARLSLMEIEQFHYLYQRTSSDLGKLLTFASEPEVKNYLESLIGRAFAQIHQLEKKPFNFAPKQWWWGTFPDVFRRHLLAFWCSVAITVLGMAFGGGAVYLDPPSKESLIPFSHLMGSPSERVAKEEKQGIKELSGRQTSFSATLMTHNTRVALTTLATGFLWGLGTIISLFYNGVILGAVAIDYIQDGQALFLLAWLLPHGSIEIPSILIAGQAGLILAHAVIGWGTRESMRTRLRKASPDLFTLATGAGLLLIWAGLVESFLSQYHEPVLPYWLKILFGLVELFLLAWFLASSGKKRSFIAEGKR